MEFYYPCKNWRFSDKYWIQSDAFLKDWLVVNLNGRPLTGPALIGVYIVGFQGLSMVSGIGPVTVGPANV